MSKKVLKFNLSKDQFLKAIEKCFNEGNYLAALRLAYSQMEEYADDIDYLTLMADIYEKMGLYDSAIKVLYQCFDICTEDEKRDILECLAVDYLSAGKEDQAIAYYKAILTVFENYTIEEQEEIVSQFKESHQPETIKFAYPPTLVDNTNEIKESGIAVRDGDIEKAIQILSGIKKGSKSFEEAKMLEAMAYSMKNDPFEAERVCKEALEDYPNNAGLLVALGTVYSGTCRKAESKKIAIELCQREDLSFGDKARIATLACENKMHKEGCRLFSELDEVEPYNKDILYFKAVSAYKSGDIDLAIDSLDKLCTIYPNAMVAKYYLVELRHYKSAEKGAKKPKLTYNYCVPEKVRENRIHALLSLGVQDKEGQMALASMLYDEGVFWWCFDEADGEDLELQSLCITAAEEAGVDWFFTDLLLDPEAPDPVKIELLELLYTRNEPDSFGAVICDRYCCFDMGEVHLGRKKRKIFIGAYAKLASRFYFFDTELIIDKTELLYKIVEERNCWELIKSSKDLACVLYYLCEYDIVGMSVEEIAHVFNAKPKQVSDIMKEVNAGLCKKRKNRKGYV